MNAPDIAKPEQTSRALINARALWLKIHRWLGLSIGLPLAVVGLTGSLIMLFGTFVSWQHGDVLQAPDVAPSTYQSADKWIAATRAEFGSQFEVAAVAAPHRSPLASNAALIIGHTHTGPEGANHKVVALDPNTAKVRGSFDLETTYAFIPNIIHSSLMIPAIGLNIVASIGVISLLSIISGLYLWWPSTGRWRRALSLKLSLKGLARITNFHNIVAVYATIGLAILSATGVWILKPHWIDPAVDMFSTIEKAPDASVERNPAACASPTDAADAIGLALARFPDKSLSMMRAPEGASGYFKVALNSSNDINPRDGDTSVFVDAKCPRLVKLIDHASLSAGDKAKKWAVPMHNGASLGLIGEILVFLAGLALPTLYVTGVIMWWRKRKYRQTATTKKSR